MERLKKQVFLNKILNLFDLLFLIYIIVVCTRFCIGMINTQSPENTAGVGDWAALGRAIGWSLIIVAVIPLSIVCIWLLISNIRNMHKKIDDKYIAYMIITNCVCIYIERKIISGIILSINDERIKIFIAGIVITIKAVKIINCIGIYIGYKNLKANKQETIDENKDDDVIKDY